MPRPVGMRSTGMRRAEMPPATAATHATNRPPTTPRGLPGRNSWPAWGRSFRSSARGVVATSGSSRSNCFTSAKPSLAFALLATSGCFGHPVRESGPIRKILTHLGEPLEPPPLSPARGPPTDWGELVQIHDDRDVFQATDRRAARDRYPLPLTGAGREASVKPPRGQTRRDSVPTVRKTPL